MRKWPGFTTADVTTGHVIRYLPRDYKIFNLMAEGWEYPEVWNFVEEKRRALLASRDTKHANGGLTPTQLKDLAWQWTLPYDPDKFPNKWWKLCRDKPSRTLMAHLGKDGYSHIHFDSDQARTISVREAARLQSFPDGFVFKGTMNPAFKQIGNAVPALMAYALAVGMRRSLGCQSLPDIRGELLRIDPRLISYTPGSDQPCDS
jgi:DNA (cytosine-5)-methyltransferase 1